MKLTDIPQSTGGNTLQFGLNTFKFDSFVVEDGQYGKQIKFVFSRPGKDDKDFTQQAWFQLYGKTFTAEDAWKMTSKLAQFKDVLAVVEEDVDTAFNEMWANAPDFDENDVDSIINLQEVFLTGLLEKVVGQDIQVVLHWKGEYLNIPTYKQNDYQLPFGKNPAVALSLNQVKAAAVHVESENGVVEPPANSGW